MFLTPVEFQILSALVFLGEAYGLKILRHDETIKRGSLYVTLARMEKKGYVDTRVVKDPAQSGPQRPLYKVTGEGERAMGAFQLASAHLAGGEVMA